MTQTDYDAKLSRIRELEYALMNIDELVGFEAESKSLQNELDRLSRQVTDIEP